MFLKQLLKIKEEHYKLFSHVLVQGSSKNYLLIQKIHNFKEKNQIKWKVCSKGSKALA